VREWNVPRLVVLSPFFLQKHEMNVAEYRPYDTGDVCRHGDFKCLGVSPSCTFTPGPGDYENLPVNCIPWRTARVACLARHGDLPTEAQLEYAASAMRGDLFVWGEADPTCDDAVWGRSNDLLSSGEGRPCAREDLPLPGGSGLRDRLDVGGGTIVDLAGNVEEWTLDFWNPPSGPCWSATRVLHDPACESPDESTGGAYVLHGGNWARPATETAAAWRRYLVDDFFSIEVGVRCARKGT
jgi:formylglycine-generating enzyme required for sulfatase activity